ncbi:MAG: nucleotidyltransferase domain-containing protein [Bacteroidales bacterium]
MLTREDAITKVKLFAKEISKLGISLDNVVLFGSYTNNNQREDSDIDIALVSSAFTGFGYEDRKLFSKINIRKEFLDIETKTYSTDYFQKGDPFIDEIKSTGIMIS